MLFTLCGCLKIDIPVQNNNSTAVQNENTVLSDESVVIETVLSESEFSETAADFSTEQTVVSEPPVTDSYVALYNYKNCFYGNNSGTEYSVTGLDPLPLQTFEKADFSLSDSSTLIEHCCGAAENGEPHFITVDNQNALDSKGLKAVCYDNKTNDRVLYLTFDCGYDNGVTDDILDTLAEKNVKAMFFTTLPELKTNPSIYARMITEGHILGNHSVTHPDFSQLSLNEMYNELKEYDDYLRQNFGYSSLYFRFPQGKYSDLAVRFINSMGYECWFWSLAYADWDLSDQRGASFAYDTVTSRLFPGCVMLLHAVSPDNAAALGDIIDYAHAQGYRFVLPS